MIATSKTIHGLNNIVSMYIMSETKPGETIIKGKKYNLNCQMSWRWSRLFNNDFFSRFQTGRNTFLTIRCAAYISASMPDSEVHNMVLLQNPTLKGVFEIEKKKCVSILTYKQSHGEQALTDESKAAYETIKPIIPYTVDDFFQDS